MAARQASFLANRGTARGRRREPAPVSSSVRNSVAENHSGQIQFDNEFMGGQQV